MQKRLLFILMVALACSLPSMAQRKVVHISELPEQNRTYHIPDVKGWVLTGLSTEAVTDQNYISTDTITPYPLWPINRQGANERGGFFANMDSDTDLEMVYTIGQKVHVWKKSGFPATGWPKDLLLYPDGAPSFGDVDGDGFGEVVVTTRTLGSFTQGYIYAFEMNGTLRPGFPKLLNGGAVRTPVLADINGDGADEIIIAVREYPEGYIYVYTGTGALYPGWPVRLDDVPATSVAVGDITGDDIPEIVTQSYISMSVFTPDGLLVPGFPYFPESGRVFSNSNPVLADINDDGEREIIFGDHSSSQSNGKIYIVKNDGTDYPGWPKQTSSWVYSPPSVGDIDDDGDLDVVVADYFHGITPSNHLYAWDAQTGDALPGFPVDSVYGAFSQALLVDIDDDDFMEIIIDANIGPQGRYLAFNHDGTPVEGWPVLVTGSTFTINPMVFDINGDGILDISGGGYDPGTDKTWIYLWNGNAEYEKENMELPILQYNTRHNGVYGDYLMVGTAPENPVKDQIKIRPNPVRSGEIAVLSGLEMTGGKLEIRWFDPSGKMVYSEELKGTGNTVSIQVPILEKGVYILSITTDKKDLFSRKMMISN